MSFEQGEIVVLELPLPNLVGSKLRPVLVVSNMNYNISSNDVVVAKITGSYFNTSWEIKLTNENLDKGKLKKTSFIDTGFLFTIEKSIINQSI